MGFAVKAELEGLSAARDYLRGVGKAVEKKALRTAVSKATRVLAKAAKSAVPKRAPKGIPANQFYRGGQLKRSLGSKVKTYPSGKVVGIVGARTNFRIQVGVATRYATHGKRRTSPGDPIFINPVKYLHLVELGTTHSRGTHFLANTMQAQTPTLIRVMTDEIAAAVRRVS